MRAIIAAFMVTALAPATIQDLRADDAISRTNYYAAYYDGHYGPITDGYWGRHGRYFWFKDQRGNWHQGDGSHFQRDAANGFALIHGSGAARSH